MAKTTPTPYVEDDDDDHHAVPLQIPPPKAKRWRRLTLIGTWTSLSRFWREAIDEAVAEAAAEAIAEAVAEAVAETVTCPLGV
jgi:hypothetical protein